MTNQNYLIINKTTNIVENVCCWDGDTSKWQPAENSFALPLDTTPALVWQLNEDKTDFVLTSVLGQGAIGFTWDGVVLTTNVNKPAAPNNNQ
jgi:hypothetical protein